MYVCIYMCLSVRVYVYALCTHVYVHECEYVCEYLYQCVCLSVHVCMFVRVCEFV